MMRSRVDLPEPDGPSSAVSEPLSTSSETSSSAWKLAEPLRDVADLDRHQLPPSGFKQGHGEQDDHGDRGEHERDAVGAREVEVLVVVLDAQRRRLGLAFDVAGDDRDGAVLAEAAGGRQDDAVDDRPADRRQRDPPERLPAGCAERVRGLLLLVADLAQRRHDLARDERQRDEDRRDHHRRQREEDLDAVPLEPGAEPAGAAVEQEEREADDDGRERERQVDDRVDDARRRGKRPPHDRERADDAEDGVQRHGDRGDDQRQLERVHRVRVGRASPRDARRRGRTRGRRPSRAAPSSTTSR